MRASIRFAGAAVVALGVGLAILPVRGDEGVQAVDTQGLPKLGDTWLDKDPFLKDGTNGKDNATAIAVGSDAYGQNCARCHGLQMISGGIAPDLRHVPLGQEGDDLFKMRMQQGAQINGMTKMPIFNGLMPQEVLWSIRTYMVSQHVED